MTDLFVARQPILDRRQEIAAFELLFHASLDAGEGPVTQDQAAFQMLHTSLLGFGLDELLGERRGFVRASRQVLVDEIYHVLPRDRSIIGLAESVMPTPEVVEACQALKHVGYHLALDDFVRRPELAPLAELADMIRVDFTGASEAERRGLVREFAPRRVELVAEHIDTRADFAQALAEGFSHFQGHFFCEPEVLTGSDVPAFKRNCVRFIAELQRPELDLERLEGLIKQEVALAVKLLRYLNSAGFGWRHEVRSIKHALRVLGERATRKWCSLIALSVLGEDQPSTTVVTAMVRAQFLEQVGREAGMGSRDGDFFLTGMLSALDVLLGRSMEDALNSLPVPAEVRRTLLGQPTSLAPVWNIVQAYERAEWERLKELADQADLSVGRLPGLYRNSVQWVDRIYRM